ncbi:restriction endonuclease subunit S [Salinispora arenicola]|uniref:restriction endonuclease subunit S n=1 Tax=Salinispora arenicola TaxID=168697 RepID=UPI00207AC40F|nr:restriction endonuclease subunit S [Salinispora arenicola]MCN0154235.1 restriction endonuclease subunit S [Salinispora arenicola]
MSEWKQVTLGDLLSRVRRKVAVEDGVSYPAASVQMYGRGLGEKEPFVGGVSKYTTLNKVRANDVVLRTITAFEAPAGVARAEHDGTHVSGVFITYEVDQKALPEFLGLYFQTPAFWEEMQNRASGTVLRRKTISDMSFRAIPFALPSLPIQERIIGVIGAVDDQITALDNEAEAAARVRGGLLDEFSSAASSDTKPLGELCPVIGSGPSWAAKDESSVPSEEAWTVLKITNTRPDGSIDLSELAYVVGLSTRTKAIGPTSLVMIRTNGNRKRIGNVYLPPEKVHGAAVSAFQFTLDAVDVETRDYLYLVLRSPRIQHQLSESASGSTGLGNLAVRWLKTLEIPWPEIEMRKLQVESVQAIDAEVAAIRAEADHLRNVRAGLLSGLLDRTIEIESAELEA